MKVGDLVADEVVLQLLVEEMSKRRASEGVDNFLLEGFPRTRRQAELFEKFVRREGVRCCVSVEATPEAKLRRLRDRYRSLLLLLLLLFC